ncbi:hypothetical protein L195_g023807 [Trifolium pratense]|uniref:Uncharacterized protein n=1 Tax=Trifolium pratense TaxID=57577 RepID=A0A2K3NBY1_TRIPR|nr:hypothetical protein L195_g023807 [Trifolium pratense]
MVEMGIRQQLAPKSSGKRTYLPPACHTLSRNEKKSFCECLRSIKVPHGYSSNVKSLVSSKDLKLVGLKSHDCHVLMQQLLPVAIRGILPKKDETFLHCVRDCNFSRNLWLHLGLSNIDFFSIMDNYDWLKLGSLGPQAFTFSAGVWLSYNIQSMVEDFMSCFTPSSADAPIDSRFRGTYHGSFDIMLAELYAIYHGLILAKDIWPLEILFATLTPCIASTLSKGNQCADFLAKLRASSGSPPTGILDLLRSDITGTVFIRE